MSREIEFRAWESSTGQMLSWLVLITQLNLNNILFRPEKFSLKLMQYTELKDKNKQTYCQDDIVRYKGRNYRLIKGTYKFELLGFKEPLQDDQSDFFSEGAYLEGEIVGNIHEHKHLLEGCAEE
ncbi:hypothetical protein HB943_02090 [Listeria weihenstephanensis]|uniref:YopX protein domain-containing protein n=1 Tax=Listeria weihenstephanensis TaxID=1006155 RepID=A0A841Z4I9_9LIST|nr:YopX family protein [Listeria weihenstephanensis]MBC1499377.1 hypothetical protein [Listeria weihenstephanensis]